MSQLIRQASMLPQMRKPFPRFMDRWGLRNYHDPDQPVVLFGCYGERELRLIRDHRSLVVLVWLGSDVMINGKRKRKLWERRRRSVRHVAIGKFIAKDLTHLGIEHRRINLYGSKLLDVLKPEPLGSAIYSYVPDARRKFFGGPILDEVRRRVPDIEFIVHRGVQVPQDQMPSVYRKCLMGLRLTRHDGGCETGAEMGLMGRRMVYNGDLPNAIHWQDAADVIFAIERERRKKPNPKRVAHDVHDFIQWDDDWLEIDQWA